jgi:hypothetical protein
MNHIEEILKTIAGQYCQAYVFIDAAGIGDSCYTRLLIQSMISNQSIPKSEILYIVPPIMASLYKDDDLVVVVPGYGVPYRIVTASDCIDAYTKIDAIINKYFLGRKIYHMGKLLCNTWDAKTPSMRQAWASASGIVLDNNISGSLIHKGTCPLPLGRPHIVLEYCCISFCGGQGIDTSNKIINKYSKNYDVCWVGAKTDPQLIGGIDCRGMDLYDTFSLLKSAAMLIHVGSGIYTLCKTFLPKIKDVGINSA